MNGTWFLSSWEITSLFTPNFCVWENSYISFELQLKCHLSGETVLKANMVSPSVEPPHISYGAHYSTVVDTVFNLSYYYSSYYEESCFLYLSKLNIQLMLA